MRVYHDFPDPDPDQRFLKWIRIRPNDTDPTGSGSGSRSGSETLPINGRKNPGVNILGGILYEKCIMRE